MATKSTVHQLHLWERLNAYVDGELMPAEEAEIAALIARDRELALMVATLTRLKATTAESVPDAPDIAWPVRRRSMSITTIAASLLIFLGVAAGTWWLVMPPEASEFRQALAQHEEWASAENPEDVIDPGSFLVAVRRLGPDVHIPDLSDAGLRIARVAALEPKGGISSLHFAYFGSRGCRVSLIIERAEGSRELRRLRVGGVAIASWAAGAAAYTLLASGMFESRFDLLATSAEQATRIRRSPPDSVRQAMREQRETSPPCAG